MRERPAGVPVEAVWSDSDNEWLLTERDEQGRKHGLETCWRPDGSLVNHCDYVHDVPHGRFVRYHESGEVSREGTFLNGRIHGVETCYRSSAPTTELAFPSSWLPPSVWRYELDRVHDEVVSTRCYDRDGNQVTETGEPVPARPATVAPTAVYSSTNATWVQGSADEQGRHHGLWRIWTRGGVLTMERDMAHGVEVASRWFACAEDADATVALREGRPDDAVRAARLWWQRTDGDPTSDRVYAGELLARCLAAAGAGADELRPLYTAVAEAPADPWVFTARGKRSHQTRGTALDWLARDALAAGRFAEAVEHTDRAIATEYHYGPAAARVTRVAALRGLGRDEEAFQAAQDVLAVDPDADGLAEVRADPRFAAWLESVRTDTMTIDGAWDVLGRRGERLATIVAPWLGAGSDGPDDGDRDDKQDDDRPAGLDVAWPIRAALGERLSPELDRWIDIAERLAGRIPGVLPGAVASTVGAAVATRDGNWVARLAAQFLPVSAILVGDEELSVAGWAPGPHGTSLVRRTHQDDVGDPESAWFGLLHRSIAGFLTDHLAYHAGLGRVTAPPGAVQRWQRADALLDEEPVPDLPAHLSVPALVPRTGWIVRHLVGIDTGHGLDAAPGWDAWQAEREQALTWPHLRAYWLLHHLVFDNREELAGLVGDGPHHHPAVAELAELATRVLAGDEPAAGWWDASAVRGLRASAQDGGHGRLMSEAARDRLAVALAGRDSAVGAATAARAALHGSDAPGLADVLETWDWMESAAGDLEAFERRLLEQLVPDDMLMDYVMRQHTGETSSLVQAFQHLAGLVGPDYLDFFDAQVRRGVGYPEEHANAVPGALVGLGVAMGDFAAFQARVLADFGPDLGRRRRSELAVVAAAQFAQPAARDYLIAEAARFAALIVTGSWTFDTVAFALRQLLEREPATGGRLLTETFTAVRRFNGATWQPSLGLVRIAAAQRCAEAAPGVLAAFDRGLGRHSDGDRARVARDYVACAGAEQAVPELRSRLESVADTDDRVDCLRCALLAGLVTAAPHDTGWHEQARAAIETLLAARLSDVSGGAAMALLKAVGEAGVPGFGDLAGQVLARVTDDKHIDAALLAWLTGAAPDM